ncbi:uncharacterized protein L201_007169 [Kwoniella dendrophila CBS 6074]|uniref:3-keto sterol reductase n=1 Tax=Kwoniella dendrophila CBS 6074 TaxID=1295534 RepID=A0AAX4K3L9_9TREE
MVSTRTGSSKLPEGVERDDNRIIAVVTGANSGFGLGICHQLLSNLSLAPGSKIPVSEPQLTALPPSLRSDPHLFTQDDDDEDEEKEIDYDNPPTLTLILACRSEKKANEAINILLERHEKDLKNRREKGEIIRKGWKENLRTVYEQLDLDNPGSGSGVLGFCQRLKERYPHITTLYLNAGMGAFSGIDGMECLKQHVTDGLSHAQSQPNYQLEIKGAKSSDGERGIVWGTNVLAPYIMVKELIPLLRRSPLNLPFEPRIIYTSSLTSSFSKLSIKDPLNDYQLLQYEKSYSASKIMFDLIMVQFDKEYGSSTKNENDNENERQVRCFTTDPGCVCTNFFSSGMGVILWWANVKFFFYWLSFYLCRLLGSTHHPVYADQGALPMIYAALISNKFLSPSSKNPAQRFCVISERWGKTKVGFEEVDQWEKGDELGKGFMEACESHRKEWKRREGLE